TRERSADELEHQREHRAFRAADREEAAMLDGLLRIGGGLAVAVERPTLRDALTLSHRHHDPSADHRGEREVDDDRVGVAPRKRRSYGVGAEKRLASAPGRDRR